MILLALSNCYITMKLSLTKVIQDYIHECYYEELILVFEFTVFYSCLTPAWRVLQVVVMLGTVVVVFFVCLLPHRIFSLWFIFTTEIEDTISTVSVPGHIVTPCRCRKGTVAPVLP